MHAPGAPCMHRDFIGCMHGAPGACNAHPWWPHVCMCCIMQLACGHHIHSFAILHGCKWCNDSVFVHMNPPALEGDSASYLIVATRCFFHDVGGFIWVRLESCMFAEAQIPFGVTVIDPITCYVTALPIPQLVESSGHCLLAVGAGTDFPNSGSATTSPEPSSTHSHSSTQSAAASAKGSPDQSATRSPKPTLSHFAFATRAAASPCSGRGLLL